MLSSFCPSYSISIMEFSGCEKFTTIKQRSRSTSRMSSLRSHIKRPVTRRTSNFIHISTLMDELIFMSNVKRFITLGSLTMIGLALTGYRVYELKKLKKTMEEQAIEVTPEKVEEVK